MKKKRIRNLLYVILMITLLVLVYARVQVIETLSARQGTGIEQVYQTSGVPVEVATVQQGRFTRSCLANAQVHGIRQSAIATPVQARIKRVHHRVGDHVAADEVIISLDKEDPRTSAQYRQLKARFETTLKNYQRILELFRTGAVSRLELDQITLQLDVDKANLESVIETVNLSSPISGIIVDLNAREGELITPGQPVALVAELERVRLTAQVSGADIRCMRVGQRVIISPGASENDIQGRVTKVALTALPGTGLFLVEMEADNQNHRLSIGTYAPVLIEVINDEQALFADLRALQQDGEGYSVFTVSKGYAERRPVEISGMNDTQVRFLTGVSAGDRVVVRGFTRLGQHTKVVY